MSPTTEVVICLLNDHRETKGITLQTISDSSGVTKGNLSRIFSGKKECTLRTARRIAESMGYTIGLKNYQRAKEQHSA